MSSIYYLLSECTKLEGKMGGGGKYAGQGGNLLTSVRFTGSPCKQGAKKCVGFFLTFCDTQQSCEISELNSSSPLGTHEK